MKRAYRVNTTNCGEAWLYRATYADGNPAVYLNTSQHEPLAVLSVNLPDNARDLPDDQHFFAKCWSENKQISADCLASGLFEDTGQRVPTGFVEAQIWRWKEGS